MSKRKHLIIGCGSAALSALKQIRRMGSEDEVKLVSMENHPPYSPMSLPYLLSGTIREAEIHLTENNFFDKMKASLVTGKRVDRIDPQGKRVIYEDNEREAFDTLLIASGSEPVRPRIKGLDEAGFLGFHTLGDYHELVRLLSKANEVVILGAGLVGMEVAAALSERGHKVTVLEKEKGVLLLSFDPSVGTLISRIFSEQGIELFMGENVTEVRRERNRLEIVCENGHTFHSDLMVTCVGVASRLSMLDGAGIETNRGILVNRRMSTNIQGIYAAGDVAEAPNFLTGQNGLSPILPSAVEQGKIAGANMIGEETVYTGWLPMNVYNFFGHLAVSIGEFEPSQGDEVFLEKDDGKMQYRKIVCRDNRLAGANFFNVDIDAGVFQYLIRNRIDMGSHKELLIEKPKETSLWLMAEAEKKSTLSLEH